MKENRIDVFSCRHDERQTGTVRCGREGGQGREGAAYEGFPNAGRRKHRRQSLDQHTTHRSPIGVRRERMGQCGEATTAQNAGKQPNANACLVTAHAEHTRHREEKRKN